MDEGCFLIVVLATIIAVVAGINKGCSTETKVAVVGPAPVKVVEPAPAPVVVVEPAAADWDLSFPYFDVGTIPFWVLTVALVLLLTVCMEWEQGAIGGGLLLLYLATLQWRGHLDIIGYVDQNRIESLYIGLAILALGCAVAFGKWLIFCRARRALYDEKKVAWLERVGVKDTTIIPDSLKGRWSKYVNEEHIEVKTKARNHKARIIRWIVFWPVVLIWSFIDDLVKESGALVYRTLANLFQRVSDFVWSGVDDDFKVAEPPPKPNDFRDL